MGQDNESSSEAKQPTQERQYQRDRMLRSAQILFGDSLLNCFVLDISISGARVGFNAPVMVPDVVTLKLRDGSTYPARRRWARGTEVGLLFTAPSAASGDERQRHRAQEALRLLQAATPADYLKVLQAERFFGDEKLRQAAEVAATAHMRLEAALRDHATTTVQDQPKPA